MAKLPVCTRGIYKMKNAVGREIPEEILKLTGKDAFAGSYAKHQAVYQAATHKLLL